MPRALLSVSNKSGLPAFARGLVRLGFEIYSTGGTLKELETASIDARPVSDLTGFPEIMDGRVKTLHPGVHGGLLARRPLGRGSGCAKGCASTLVAWFPRVYTHS